MAKTQNEILFAGRLERRKGLSTLVEAVPQVLNKCETSVFGFVGSDGENREEGWRNRILARVSPKDRSRIIFEEVPRSSMVERYRRAAICVAPSIWENFPYVLLEAMACGTPVVATRVGGVLELVEDGVSGLLVPADDPVSLTNAICTLLDDQELAKNIAGNAFRRVLGMFSIEQIIPQMVQVYNHALN